MSDSTPSMPATHRPDPAVRGALHMAITSSDYVVVVLRDKETGVPSRTIEGTPIGIVPGPDGRERVFIRVAEGTEQMVLLERIVRVIPSGAG